MSTSYHYRIIKDKSVTQWENGCGGKRMSHREGMAIDDYVILISTLIESMYLGRKTKRITIKHAGVSGS